MRWGDVRASTTAADGLPNPRGSARSRSPHEHGTVGVDGDRDPDPVVALSVKRAVAVGLGRPACGGGLGFGSGMLGYPCARRQFESRSSFVCVWADGAAAGGAFTGSRCWQAVWAVLNAGEDGLSPGTSWKLRSSGKFDTPCDRMQRVKFSVARRAWSWFGFVRPPELDELSEPEPHAAIAVTTAIVAAVRAGVTHPRRGGGMTRVRWFSMPQPGSTRPC